MSYFNSLIGAMEWLSTLPRTVFVGQGVGCAGTTMTDTLKGVPPGKLLEFPVAEDMQMGFCTGLALDGQLPICIFPRWNFLLCATNQIVNHLDRLPLYSNGGYRPKVIIRVATPRTAGFNPGPQHDDDATDAFHALLRTIEIVTLEEADKIIPAYQKAAQATHSTLLVEYTEMYNAIPSGVKS